MFYLEKEGRFVTLLILILRPIMTFPDCGIMIKIKCTWRIMYVKQEKIIYSRNQCALFYKTLDSFCLSP